MYKRYCGQLYVDVLHDYRIIILYIYYYIILTLTLELLRTEVYCFRKSYFKHFVDIDFF